ncbi:MAG: siderophore-interacting protein, partial [Acidimicrobiia bacterium]
MGLEDFDAIPTFVTRVVRVADENPRLRRITFGGGDLARFAPLGPDTFVYVLLPPPGRRDLTVDRSFTWLGWAATPEEDRAVGGYYTVRAWRPEPAEVDALFELHEPAGPASAWAARAEPGDPVALWGPREAYAPPPGTEWLLLV